MTSLLLVPLDDTVVFPTMDVTLPVRVGDEERVLLIPRHDGEFAKVGTIAEVTDHIRLPGGGRAVALSGVARGVAGAAHTDSAGRLMIEVTEHRDDVPVDGRTRNLEREYRAIIEEILELRGADERIGAFLRAIADPGPLADTIGYAPDVSFEDKLAALETLDVSERLELVVKLQRERLTELQLRKKIREDVQSGADKQQREYILRKQMESIQRELGEDGASIAEEYRKKIAEAGMPEAVEGAGRQGARAARAHGRAVRRGLDDPDLPRLADRGAVEQDLRREARSARRARGARRRPRGPRGRQGPDHRVPGRAQAAAGPWDRGGQALRRDPHADRPARHRQDLASASRSPARPDASSSACRWAASATRPRSAATGARTSVRSRAAWCVRCATPGR